MSTKSQTRTGQIARRSKKRGVAMVEAALVMPALITCFGVTMLAGGARYQQQAQQQLARQGVLSYATDACQAKRAGAISGSGDPGVPDLGSGQTDTSGASNTGDSRVSTGIGDALSNTTNNTKSFGAASGSHSGPWSFSRAYVNSSLTLTGTSFYMCNEKGWGRWDFFGYAKNLVTQFLP